MRNFVMPLLLTAFFSGGSAGADEDLSVLKRDSDIPPAKMLNVYLHAEAKKHFDARRQAIAALKTAEDVKKRQAELKAKFLEALGDLPERTPLNPVVTGKHQGPGYRVERVIYESRPSHHVTALFYLPDPLPSAKVPGVLLPCGHDTNGKLADSYQRASILLARYGMAVLCYDPIGQGERSQLVDAMGKRQIQGGVYEHTLIGAGALLIGRSAASYRIWDGLRSLDYLTSRPEVDGGRIGCTGCSGGGTLTSYLMALDDRIVAAAPSCYITSLERLFATIGPQDAEQNITGQVAFGMEHADYLTMRAPKPTLICAATRDFFDIQGTWTSFREAKQLYGILGHGDRVDLFEYNTPHGYPRPQREAIVRFMRRWLLDKNDSPEEGDVAVSKDQELWCTRTGQVLEDLKGKSAFHLNAEREDELAGLRKKAERNADDLRKEVRKRIGQGLNWEFKVKELKTVDRDGYEIRKLVYEPESGIQVPALHFRSKESASAPIIIYVHGQGKAADASVSGPIEKLVKAGNQVLAVDPRGIGETQPAGKPSQWSKYFGSDASEAFLSLHLDRPLLGQRVSDVLGVCETVLRDPTTMKNEIHIIGIGTAGPIALHAAALEPRIKRVTLEQSPLSWSSVVRTPISYSQLGNVVPGALKGYDLPDLTALVAPRPLTIRRPLDAAQQPVKQADLDAAYATCKTAYVNQKAAKDLILLAD